MVRSTRARFAIPILAFLVGPACSSESSEPLAPPSAGGPTTDAEGGSATDGGGARDGATASDGGSASDGDTTTDASSDGGTGGVQVKAFPSAEGFGTETRGAYGKTGVTPTVYTVTNLNDPDTRAPTFDGSFRWALEAPEPRIIVFAVSGYISIKKPLQIDNPYLDVEAQTAPGDGIALRNDPTYGGTTIRFVTHDVIVRHLRARPGPANSGVVVDSNRAIDVGGTSNVESYNVVIDHCSATWGIDGDAQTSNTTHDVTFQWNIISEGLNNAGHSKGAHARAFDLYVGSTNPDVNGRISIHHNLMSHVQYRVPQIAIKNGLTEVVNNVVYHTTQMGISINSDAHSIMGESKNRIVKNYLLRTATTHADVWLESGDIASGGGHLAGDLVHTKGNIGPTRTSDSMPENVSMSEETTSGCTVCYSTNPATARNHWTADPLCTAANGTFPYPSIRVSEDAAQVALDKVSGTGSFAGQMLVGATKPRRDGVDARIVKQLATYIADPNATDTVPVHGGPNGGLLDDPAQVGGYPTLASGPVPTDGDHDGIPDSWEQAHGLNPASAQDAHAVAANGYTNLENYVNELAGDTIP